MKEIKFRAWEFRKKEMCKVTKINFTKDIVYLEMKDNHSMHMDSEQLYMEHATMAKNVILEQFTGLTDKNGVEIYEGDMVRYNFNNNVLDTEKKWIESEVYYHELRNTYVVNANKFMNNDLWKYANQGTNEVEVIGNIHEVYNENN